MNTKKEYLIKFGNETPCYLFLELGNGKPQADFEKCMRLFSDLCRALEREKGYLDGSHLDAVCEAVSSMHEICFSPCVVEIGVNWWRYTENGEQKTCEWRDADGGFLSGRTSVDTGKLLTEMARLVHVVPHAPEKNGWDTIVPVTVAKSSVQRILGHN